jgi:hypothetical protein
MSVVDSTEIARGRHDCVGARWTSGGGQRAVGHDVSDRRRADGRSLGLVRRGAVERCGYKVDVKDLGGLAQWIAARDTGLVAPRPGIAARLTRRNAVADSIRAGAADLAGSGGSVGSGAWSNSPPARHATHGAFPSLLSRATRSLVSFVAKRKRRRGRIKNLKP